MKKIILAMLLIPFIFYGLNNIFDFEGYAKTLNVNFWLVFWVAYIAVSLEMLASEVTHNFKIK